MARPKAALLARAHAAPAPRSLLLGAGVALGGALLGAAQLLRSGFVTLGEPTGLAPAHVWAFAALLYCAAACGALLYAYALAAPRGLLAALAAGLAAAGASVWALYAPLLGCGVLFCSAAAQRDPTGAEWLIGGASGASMLAAGLTSGLAAAPRFGSRLARLPWHWLALPLISGWVVVCSILPNQWHKMTQFKGRTPNLGAYMASGVYVDGKDASSVAGAVFVPIEWRWSQDLCLKIWPDLYLFYGYLALLVCCGAASKTKSLARVSERRLRGWRCYDLFLLGTFLLMASLYAVYWAHDHQYAGGQFRGLSERLPRACGQVAVMLMALLLLPASRSSPLLDALNLSWEASLWAHRALGGLWALVAVAHIVAFWSRFGELGLLPHDMLPTLTYYPVNNPTAPLVPGDDFTVGTMTLVALPSLLLLLFALPAVRRRRFALFKLAHHVPIMVLVPATIAHAPSGWYYLLPPLSLWAFDKARRFVRSAELELEHAQAEDGIVELAFRWPAGRPLHAGSFVFLHVPQLSRHEWHPFSTSSSPLDELGTVHIKAVQSGKFTQQLLGLVERSELARVQIDGPFGRPIRLHGFRQVHCFAAGIGVTPVQGLVRHAGHLVELRSDEVKDLQRLRVTFCCRTLPELQRWTWPWPSAGPTLEVERYCTGLPPDAPRAQDDGVLWGRPAIEVAASGRTLVLACGPPQFVGQVEAAVQGTDCTYIPFSFVL